MSYQGQNTIQSFIPNYVVKSDYLPNRVNEGSNAHTAELVHMWLVSSIDTRRRRAEGTCSPSGQPNSTPRGILRTKCTRQCSCTSRSMSKPSAAL